MGRRYDAVKNAFLSYRPVRKGKTLRTRISGSGETFATGRKMLARLVLVSGYLRLFLALDPNAYSVQKYHHRDYTEVARYAGTPFMIKLSSERQIRYALELIGELMLANGFERDESYVPRDQAGIFGAPRRHRAAHATGDAAAPAIAAALDGAMPPERDEGGKGAEGDAPEREPDEPPTPAEEPVIDVRLPVRARVVDRSGNKLGKIRSSVWYDAEENVRGEFRKEDVNVFLYTEGARCAYVDKNDNILTPGNAYVATIRRFSWLPVLLIVIFLALATALSVLLSAYFMSRSESIEYAPVLFVASEDGTQWEGSENLPVFVNEAFGDNVIAPGMNGTYRFTLRNDNDDPLIFLLEFSEDNEHGIALLYRLKRDGVYIAGHDTHVGTEDICVYDMTIEPNSTTVFELEWLWKDNDEVDTEAGQNEATYVLHIAFSAYVGRQGQA